MRVLLFVLLVLALGPPAAFAIDETPAPLPAPTAVPGGGCACPCPPGPPPPLIMPLPGTHPPQPLYPPVYLRNRSVHDGPAGYRSAPWRPITTPPTTEIPPRPPYAGPWWPW